MFFLILVCTFYSTKKLIGEVIGNIKFEDEKDDQGRKSAVHAE